MALAVGVASAVAGMLQAAGTLVSAAVDVWRFVRDQYISKPASSDDVDQQLESVVKKTAPCIEKIQMFQERLSDVLKSLRNDEVRGIKISGMIGVGKTTIMLNLNNHNDVAQLFDVVIWVDVSEAHSNKNFDTKYLQCKILERLNKESTEDAPANASRIFRTLQHKKYLILLDGVKENIDLGDIGIPDGKKGSKVVWTTIRNDLCCSLVHKEVEVVKVATLSEHKEDALEMFQGILEDPEFCKDRKRYRLAKQVLEVCHYIPLLIEQIAKAIKLKNEAKESWFIYEIGCNLQHLRDKVSEKLVEEYYQLLKAFYYGQMGDVVQKRCFLFSALYPDKTDIYFEHLKECLAALYFDGNDHENVSLKVCETLECLLNLSLLEKSKEDCVTMPIFIRKMALDCASSEGPECNYLVKTNKALQECPAAESWRNQHHISLGQNKFYQLPPLLDCSGLSTLLLQENLNLKEIPASCFQRMERLKILDMCQTGIESLPLPSRRSDLICLKGLKVLYLRDCLSLKQLNGIRFPLLEVLDIRGSKIHNILTDPENLQCLRRLWISFEKCRVENGTEVRLSQLSALEELFILMESFDQWNNKALIRDLITQVASLEKLRSLEFCFPDKEKVINVIKDEPHVEIRGVRELEVRVPHVEILQIFIAQSCLWSDEKSFLLFIGRQIPEDPHFPVTLGYEKYIKYCDGEGTDPPIPEVLATVEAFELVNHKDIAQLSGFGSPLLKLQHLHLKDLPKLTNIWSEPGDGLRILKTLLLSGCPMLTTIFPTKIIELLVKMESLTVENCSGAEKIFERFENNGNDLNQLPNLKEMKLKELRNLQDIWADESSKCQSLKSLTLDGCRRFDEESVKINAPNLDCFAQKNAMQQQPHVMICIENSLARA